MFDHIGIRVKDLDASVRFYEAALAALGHTLGSRDSSSAGFGPKGAPAFWLYKADDVKKKPTHVAFRAVERAAVDRFHERGARAGGLDHGKPGLRLDYAPEYYAAFLLDPDGNNVEAVCMVKS